MEYFVRCIVTLPHFISCEICNGAFKDFASAEKSYKCMTMLCNFLLDEGAIIKYDLNLESW